tara:strand:+ start:4590 stop:5039 length:450 start_codon:yes stop_codon:yes gene_type:complete
MILCFFLYTGCLHTVVIAEAKDIVVIRNDGVAVWLALEYVRDQSGLKEGLMWRKSLPRRSGMLFDFSQPVIVRMWMKNTYIPLDMLFVTEGGLIIQIERNLIPHSLSSVVSIEPVRYVIEINGDEARRLGLDIGDMLFINEDYLFKDDN